MPAVCVIVPCYNEEHRLKGAEFLAFLRTHPDVTLCFVDDGSADRTLSVLQDLRTECPAQVLVHAVSPNGGKAEAVRAGVQHAHRAGPWPIFGYWDADLSTPLSEIDRLMTVLEGDPSCRLAMGSRVKRLGSHIERRVMRHILGRIFSACATGILGFSVYDSQCGAKLFRRDTVDVFFREPFMTRWLFDLEMLARLRNSIGLPSMDTAREVPLGHWTEVGGSKLRLREMIQVPLELLKIREYYNRPAP
jgi:glycosyltransferase involved in cell wall biosynthesis